MSLTFPQFAKYSNLKYGFSSRHDGSMHRHLKKSNRENYFKKVGIDSNHVVTADLVHGEKIAKVLEKSQGTMIADTDGLITNAKNLFLSATAADCFLLYFYDPIENAVGITHVGWRGLLAGVVENSITELNTNFGIIPANLLVGIAPGIRECHFEISMLDKEKFKEYKQFSIEKDGKIFINLPGIIKFKLGNAGVKQENIQDSGVCTYCNEQEYFSFRRDKPSEVQVMMGYIGLV